MKKATPRQQFHHFSEAQALALVEVFKREHPDQSAPGGSDRDLQAFMEARTIDAARHWRRIWEKRKTEMISIASAR